MFTHNTTAVLPVVTTLIFLVAIAATPQFRWLRLRNLIIANLVVLALYAFWIPRLLDAVERLPPQWELAPVEGTFLAVYANEHITQAIVLVGLCAAALWGWRRREAWRWIGFTLLGTLALPLMLLIVSLLYRPVIFPRTIIWTAIPIFVACGAGLARLSHAGLRYLLLAGLLLVNLYGVQPGSRDDPWHEVAGALAEMAADDAAIVLCPNYNVLVFYYYWRDYERKTAVFGRLQNMAVAPFLESAAGEVSRWQRSGKPRDMVSLFDEHAEVWVVVRKPDNHHAPECDPTALAAVFSGRAHLVSVHTYGSALRLIEYARDNPLTAAFEDVPAEHDGENVFRFRVAFSEDIANNYGTWREESFTVTEGRVTEARRIDGRNDLWEITVEPDSREAVTITLPGGRACGTSGAVCTGGDALKPLGNSPSAAVAMGSPAEPLRAAFEDVPAEHDGENVVARRRPSGS